MLYCCWHAQIWGHSSTQRVPGSPGRWWRCTGQGRSCTAARCSWPHTCPCHSRCRRCRTTSRTLGCTARGRHAESNHRRSVGLRGSAASPLPVRCGMCSAHAHPTPPNTLTSHLSVEALQVLVPDGHKHVSAVEPQLVGALAAPQNLCKWCQVRIGEQRASSSKYMQGLTVRWPAASIGPAHWQPCCGAPVRRCLLCSSCSCNRRRLRSSWPGRTWPRKCRHSPGQSRPQH